MGEMKMPMGKASEMGSMNDMKADSTKMENGEMAGNNEKCR